jgi:predicted nucleotidyltransferase
VPGLTVDDRIREKRELIVRLAARYGATEVRLIGPFARGDAALTATSICS